MIILLSKDLGIILFRRVNMPNCKSLKKNSQTVRQTWQYLYLTFFCCSHFNIWVWFIRFFFNLIYIPCLKQLCQDFLRVTGLKCHNMNWTLQLRQNKTLTINGVLVSVTLRRSSETASGSWEFCTLTSGKAWETSLLEKVCYLT